MGEPFVRPLTSERRFSRASDIADEDIGSDVHLHFQESCPGRDSGAIEYENVAGVTF